MAPRDEADRAFDAFLRDRRPEDLARVFDRTAPRLLLLASHLAGRAADAEDLVQATFLRAIEVAPERFERGRPVLPWLCGILANEARKVRRADARAPDPERLDLPEEDAPDAAAALQEMRAELERAVAELPEGYAQVLNLRLIHGLTPIEIAHSLGVSPETVKTRIRRGTERLRAKLPVGFAAVLALVSGAGRSLSLVREAVIASAGGAGTAVAATATATVAAAGKGALGKAAAAIALAAAAGYGAWELTREDVSAPVPEQRTAVAAENDDPEPGPTRTPVVVPSTHAEPAEEPPEAPPLFASIEGRFRDQRGLVAGVEVTLMRLHPDAFLVPWAPIPAVVEAPPLVVGTAATDAGGRFVFEAVPPGGVWLLRVDAPGRPAFVELVAERPPLDERVDLGVKELPPVWETEGRVLDPRGRAVPGAIVRRAPVAWGAPVELGLVGELLEAWNEAGRSGDDLLALDRRGGGADVFEAPLWLTGLRAMLDAEPVAVDARGKFQWRSVHGFRDRLLVEAPGFAPSVFDVTLSRDGAELEPFVLEPWDEVEVKVVDALGAPVADAEVAAWRSTGRQGVSRLPRQGTTALDGTLSVRARDGAPLVVAARRGPGEPWHVEHLPAGLLRTIRLPARHTMRLRFRSREGLEVEGAAVRLLPGESYAQFGLGALALFQLGAAHAVDAAIAREEGGVVRIEDVAEGPWIAMVAAPGFLPRAIPLRVHGPVDERVELLEAGSTRVEVLDQSFAPLRGVMLAVAPVAGTPHALPAICGRTGRDAAAEVARDRWTDLAVAVADPGRGGVPAVVPRGEVEEQLVMRGTGGIDGVLASPRDGFVASSWLVVARRVGPSVVAEAPVFAGVDVDGTMRVSGLTPGRWEVTARPVPGPLVAFGSMLALLWPEAEPDVRVPADVLPGSSAGLRFDPWPEQEPVADEPRSLRGRLTFGGGPPSNLADLMLVRDGRETNVLMDADGNFDAGLQAPGDAELVVSMRVLEGRVELWRAGLRIDVDPAPLAIDLSLTAFGAMLLTADGKGAGGGSLTLAGTAATTPPGRVELRLRASPGGLVTFDHVPSGNYTIEVMDAAHGWLRNEALRFGPTRVTTGMSIRLEPLLRMAGRAGDVGVADVARTSEVLLVRAEPDGVALQRVGVFDAGGTFTVDGLLPGRYRATLRVALLVAGREGGVVLIPPSQTGIVVDLADVIVPEENVRDVVLTRR